MQRPFRRRPMLIQVASLQIGLWRTGRLGAAMLVWQFGPIINHHSPFTRFSSFASLANVAKGGDGAKSALREIFVFRSMRFFCN